VGHRPSLDWFRRHGPGESTADRIEVRVVGSEYGRPAFVIVDC
jgi:hypothetical protein